MSTYASFAPLRNSDSNMSYEGGAPPQRKSDAGERPRGPRVVQGGGALSALHTQGGGSKSRLDRVVEVELPTGAAVRITEHAWRTGKTEFGTNYARWEFVVPGGNAHTVELKHSLFSGKRKVTVDGRTVIRKYKFLDGGSSHSFMVGAHVVGLQIALSGEAFRYHLRIDDVDVDDARHGLRTMRDQVAYERQRARAARAELRTGTRAGVQL